MPFYWLYKVPLTLYIEISFLYSNVEISFDLPYSYSDHKISFPYSLTKYNLLYTLRYPFPTGRRFCTVHVYSPWSSFFTLRIWRLKCPVMENRESVVMETLFTNRVPPGRVHVDREAPEKLQINSASPPITVFVSAGCSIHARARTSTRNKFGPELYLNSLKMKEKNIWLT